MTTPAIDDVPDLEGAGDALRERRRKTLSAPRRTTRVVLLVAVIARLIVLFDVIANYPHDWLFGRGVEMGLLADSLLHGLGYSSPFGGSTGPTAFIAPGYPTLIAGVFSLFGSYSFASEIVIMLLQILAGLATVWLVMHVARRVFDERTATLAGAFWAISLPLLWLPTIFWETNLSACALTGAIALAMRCGRRPSRSLWLLLGAGFGVVALINPALLPVLLVILAWTAWQGRRTMPRGGLLGVLAMLVVFSPWPIRNAIQFHAFIPLRTTVGFELWMGNRPGATGFLDESVFPMFDKRELASYVAMGELPYTQAKTDAAKAYIQADPKTFFVLSARRFFRFWTGTGNSHGSPIFAIHAVLTTVLGGAGLWLLARRRRWSLVCLLGAPLLLFPMPYYITHAEFRYRIVIDPLLTILGAYAATRLVAERRPAATPETPLVVAG